MSRIPGIGVRAKGIIGNTVSEFVIRESKDGNQTLSLISEGELIQVVTSKRDQLGNVSIEKHMTTKNINTFSHYRYDWLDDFKLMWWGTSALGLIFLVISIFMPSIIGLGIFLFSVGLFLTLIQIADPEYIVFETSSGAHRFFIYRIGSNLPLTESGMAMIDDVMQEYILTGTLNSTSLDNEAERIESERNIQSNYPTTPPPTVAPSTAPPTAAPTTPPPMAPPTAAPTAPPPMAPPLSNIQPNSEFSEIPPPPPVDFSDIPAPPNVEELQTVSDEDKNELLDVLK